MIKEGEVSPSLRLSALVCERPDGFDNYGRVHLPAASSNFTADDPPLPPRLVYVSSFYVKSQPFFRIFFEIAYSHIITPFDDRTKFFVILNRNDKFSLLLADE